MCWYVFMEMVAYLFGRVLHINYIFIVHMYRE